jgi:hypothetical protein
MEISCYARGMATEILMAQDLHAALEQAGIIPANCGDVIIEVRMGAPVIIHEIRFADNRLLEVIGAHVAPASIELQKGT